MSGLQLTGIRKVFGDVAVLSGVSLAMEPREFIAFLGPSGSGKSTLLRIIAGLESADAGEVWLDGARIDQRPPGERGVAMVFQHYALYPHMTVRDNMAFGLKNGRVAANTISARIDEAARSLEIEPLLDRKPGQLSGGQRQRVAIGRAIVKQPRLFLLDEPLSNLDAALRNRTRVELAQLRQRVDAGIIMVTHDQAEAMTLADRIVVLNDGCIQQIGAPMEIYNRPANAFVARFVGSPAMAMRAVTRAKDEGGFAQVQLGADAVVATRVPGDSVRDGALTLGLRPEAITLAALGAGTIDAEVILVERLGDKTLVYARLAGGGNVTAQDGGASAARMGDRIGLRIDGRQAHLFGADGTCYQRHPAA